MAIIKADFNLYLCAQGSKTTGKYYKIFVSTVDTINVNRGNVGLHLLVFKRYVQPMKYREVEGSGKELTALAPDKLKTIK